MSEDLFQRAKELAKSTVAELKVPRAVSSPFTGYHPP